MSKKATRRSAALSEISELRAKRRKNIAACVVALVVILAFVGLKTYFTAIGTIDASNMLVNGITMFVAIGLAILGGTASINFTKAKGRIDYLRQMYRITDSEIVDFEKAVKLP